MELNVKKIKADLKRLDKTQVWLAQQLNVKKQRITQIFKAKSVKNAVRIAKVLGYSEPKDLIK